MTEKREQHLSRRRFVELAGVATTGALAGCGGLTQRRFEANAYGLTGEGQLNSFLGEVARTSKTVKREPEVGPISGEITIVNQVSGYTRGNAVSQALGEADGEIAQSSSVGDFNRAITLIERWLRRVNATQGAGSALVISADDMPEPAGDSKGIPDEANPGSLKDGNGDPITVPSDEISLVVPGQAREDGVTMNEMMALQLGGSFNVDQITVGSGSNIITELKNLIPVQPKVKEIPWPSADSPIPRWGLGVNQLPDDTPCLVCLAEGQSFEEVFGAPTTRFVEIFGSKNLPEGQTVDLTENMVVAMPAPKEFPGGEGTFDLPPVPQGSYGMLPPLRGSTYGFGVFATPAAKVAGQSLNPLSQLGLRDFLTSPQARSMLREAGVTDADTVDWLQGPEEVLEPTNKRFLGVETQLKTFAGVVSGDAASWCVAVHIARANVESDIMIGAGTYRYPTGAMGSAPSDAPDSITISREFTGNLGTALVASIDPSSGF